MALFDDFDGQNPSSVRQPPFPGLSEGGPSTTAPDHLGPSPPSALRHEGEGGLGFHPP
jgi:hypothetical protein